jgi:hypothetical protein
MHILRTENRTVRNVKWQMRNVIIAALVIGCGTLTAVTIQQAHTIEVQRTLIHQLFQDSIQLGALRMQQRSMGHEQ